jgi:hypothetical protein
VHQFVFNEVKTVADPATSSKSVSGIKPASTIGPQDMQKVKAAMALLKIKSEKLGPRKSKLIRWAVRLSRRYFLARRR